ncbi:MAG TPA: DUF899 family protein [Pseudonocardiaceae bacterium]|jgi:predicted dithiol-disulfide oxidoreductase (DUF899 family)|nr:DUF899 family protein [Pseudonocardiaceae bacterium]
MSVPSVASRDEWLAARLDLLEREKQVLKDQDAVTAQRRALPMVERTRKPCCAARKPHS